MDTVPVFEPEEPAKKRRGVSVVTKYGRGLTFGVRRERAERLLKSLALRHNHAGKTPAPAASAPRSS